MELNQFDDRTCQALVNIVRDNRRTPPPRDTKPTRSGTTEPSMILKTGGSGIPARSGDTCGSGTCTLVTMDSDGVLSEYTGRTGDPSEFTVWNLATEDVAADSYIMAKRIGGRLFVDWEEC